MRYTPYSSRQKELPRIKDADQAEKRAIALGSATVDSGLYDNRVADALDDYDPRLSESETDRWHRLDLTMDTAVGQAHEEVQRRVDLMGDAYPFVLLDGQLRYRPSRSGFYELCLAISLAEQITSGDNVRLPRLFERLSALLIQAYMGEDTGSVHIGSPRDADIGTTFVEAGRCLQQLTREWIWGPEDDLPEDPKTTGDEGVDFVVWKAPVDGRAGRLFIMGQCACGDNWIDKFGDVSINRFRKWFRPLGQVDPVRAFALPRHIGDGYLNEALKCAGLVFDRARLTVVAERLADDSSYRVWSDSISACTRLVISDSDPVGQGA